MDHIFSSNEEELLKKREELLKKREECLRENIIYHLFNVKKRKMSYLFIFAITSMINVSLAICSSSIYVIIASSLPLFVIGILFLLVRWDVIKK